MKHQELVGRTITNIFETKSSIVHDGIPGPASYFDIVIELDKSDLYELGAHDISNWNKDDYLIPFEKSAWAIQNNFKVIGKRITKIIQRDSEEFYDGSLTLLLENSTILEHQTTNGYQLFIDEFEEQ